MSKIFDYINGETDGPVAKLEAELEHTAGYLGQELAENARLRTALERIERICWREGPIGNRVAEIRKIANKALQVTPSEAVRATDE